MTTSLTQPKIFRKQQGAAVLLVSIVLLIGVTLIVVFAAKVGVMDQRIAGNEYRHIESEAAANAALDQAAGFLEENTGLYETSHPSWVDCSDASLTNQFPCKIVGTTTIDYYELAFDGDLTTPTILDPLGTTVDLPNVESDSYLVFTTSASIGNIVTAIGTGKSADGTGDSIAQISYAKATILTTDKLPPVMAPVANLSGSFLIVADPQASLKDGGVCTNGESDFDFPVSRNDISVWTTTSDGANTGSWSTCLRENFVNASGQQCVDVYDDTDSHTAWGNCTCNDNLSEAGGTDDEHIKYDIRIVGRNSTTPFPSSPLEYIFGSSDLSSIQAKAGGATACADLASVDLTSTPLVYVAGDCSIGDLGTRANPIFLVVGGDLTINANSDIWGIVIGVGEVSFNGSPIIHGSVVSEDPTKLTNGNYTQIFDWCVNDNLINALSQPDLLKMKYSWRNYKP